MVFQLWRKGEAASWVRLAQATATLLGCFDTPTSGCTNPEGLFEAADLSDDDPAEIRAAVSGLSGLPGRYHSRVLWCHGACVAAYLTGLFPAKERRVALGPPEVPPTINELRGQARLLLVRW